MIKTKSSIIINRPVGEVFAFMGDFRNCVLWLSGVLEIKQQDQAAIGTRVVGVHQSFGKRIEVGATISDFEPDRRLAVKSTYGPISFTIIFDFEAAGRRKTKLTYTSLTEIGSIYQLAEPVLKQIGKQRLATDLKALKSILESKSGTLEAAKIAP